MSDITRTRVEETLEVFQKFDEKLAVEVSWAYAKWDRWDKTTTEDDWFDISIGESAEKRWNEWEQVKKLLQVKSSSSLCLSMKSYDDLIRSFCRFLFRSDSSRLLTSCTFCTSPCTSS